MSSLSCPFLLFGGELSPLFPSFCSDNDEDDGGGDGNVGDEVIVCGDGGDGRISSDSLVCVFVPPSV